MTVSNVVCRSGVGPTALIPLFVTHGLFGGVPVDLQARVQVQANSRALSTQSLGLFTRVSAASKIRAGGSSTVRIAAMVTAAAKALFGRTSAVSIFARITAASKAMQPSSAPFSSSGLWRTDAFPSDTSTYVEAKQPMNWIYETVLLPDNQVMALNAINESNIGFAFLGDSPTVTVTAADNNGVTIDQVIVQAPGTDTLWGEFNWGEEPWGGTATNLSPWRLNWTQPLIFKQMAITAEGVSASGLRIGNLYMRYQILGYRQQRQSGVR